MRMTITRSMVLALVVALASFLQGWVFVIPIGHFSYDINHELKLEAQPSDYGVVFVTSVWGLVSAFLIMQGMLRRRPLVLISSLLFMLCSTMMLLSPYPSLVVAGRIIGGFGSGFSFAVMTLYFLETGRLGILHVVMPRFANGFGAFLCNKVLGTQEVNGLEWRVVLGISFVLSLIHLVLVVFFVPESPLWLVSKGRIDEARQVLQKLYGCEDVSDEIDSLHESVIIARYIMYPRSIGPRGDVSSSDFKVTSGAPSGQVNSASQNGSITAPLLTVSGDGGVGVGEESLTTEEEDCSANADASKLTVVTVE